MERKIPLYLMVMEKLKKRISEGDFTYDTPFATEEKVTREYGVSRITAIRALDEMEKEGLLYRKRGRGSFVSKNVEMGGKVSEARKKDGVVLIALVLPFDVKYGGMLQCFDGINTLFNKGNCFIKIYNTNRRSEEEASVLKELLENDIDGVICYPEKDNTNLEIYNQFLTKEIPLVLIDKHIENMPISYVVPDNYNGAKTLCDYAIDRGHKNIAFLSLADFSGVCSLRDRYMGYASSINEHGMQVNLNNVFIGAGEKLSDRAVDSEEYSKCLGEIIESMQKAGVSAVVCQNDWVARDVIHKCDEMGISVPGELLVMGFDHASAFSDMDVSERLVTVEQNFYEIGRKAGELILKGLDEKNNMCMRIVVPMKLVINEITDGDNRAISDNDIPKV